MNSVFSARNLLAQLLLSGMLLVGAGIAVSATHYVDLNSATAAPPYTSWSTAATNIQDAVDAAAAGDEIVITNGIYATGGRSVDGITTNRVAVEKAIALRSLNGPQFTIIDGAGSDRCVYLANGASLSGFTLTNGRARVGGGLWCASTSTVVSRCLVSGNSSLGQHPDFLGTGLPCCSQYFALGGGVYGGTLNNCTLSDNEAETHGFPGHTCELTTCRTVGDGGVQIYVSLGAGGGAANAVLNNCTLTGNRATIGGGAYQSVLINCIAYLNADENYDSSSTLNYCCTTPLPTNGVGNMTNAPMFVGTPAGNFHLRPDSPCIDAGTNLSVAITNDLDGRPRPLDGNGDGVASFDMGAYEYRTPLLVWQDSSNPTPPYANWVGAAHSIQDAVDAAVAGDEIVVTNGIYGNGGRSLSGEMNRVVLDRALTLRSVNGPQFTVIDGGSSNRCVFLSNNASLCGFTLTHGVGFAGGAVRCSTVSETLSNCVLAGNGAEGSGGGAFGGTLNNCTLTGNRAGDGGGADSSTLNNCLISRNSADDWGAQGGGVFSCTLNNCTIVGNSAGYFDIDRARYVGDGGGAYNSTLNNCILYDNLHAANTNNYRVCILNHCCTMPQPTNGFGNVTNAPLFVDEVNGNLRLQSNSPCINAGRNSFAPVGFDLDGNQRIKGDTVDIGAYEFQSPASIISYAWLQQYGLATDGSADFTDPDGDGLNNWQEWRCGTDPTNALSALRLLTPITAGTNIIVTWQSVAGVNYFLERSTNSTAPLSFATLAVNLEGQTNTTTYTDTNAVGTGVFLYRVGAGP